MTSRYKIALMFLVAAASVGLVAAWTRADGEKKAAANPPEIAGAWIGDWGPYDPAKGMALETEKCKKLDCQVVAKGGIWEATFEGECGRPYKYTIKMEGRQAGEVVLFKGTVDLGEKDGGVYDWVGRATDKDFAGFYTSSHHVGVFRLARAK